MRLPAKPILWLVAAVGLSVTILFAYRMGQERRMNREEKVLNALMIDIEFKDASVDEAARLVVDKVHRLGHPEMRFQIFANSRESPNFHVKKADDRRLFASGSPLASGPRGPEKINVRFTSALPVAEVAKYLGGLSDTTCVVRGNVLLVVPADGTFAPFRRKTFRLRPGFFALFSDRALATFAKDNGLTFYEGMAVNFDRKASVVEIVGPDAEVDLLEEILDDFRLPSRWEAIESAFEDWRKCLLGF